VQQLSHDERRRSLVLAVAMLGNPAACRLFATTEAGLNAWMTGAASMPEAVLVAALNVILEDPESAAEEAALLIARRSGCQPLH
jgi:hypothetical protein